MGNGPTATGAKVDSSLPTRDMLEKCANLPLLEQDGAEHSFESIVNRDSSKDRHMLIFIRHFFCGVWES